MLDIYVFTILAFVAIVACGIGIRVVYVMAKSSLQFCFIGVSVYMYANFVFIHLFKVTVIAIVCVFCYLHGSKIGKNYRHDVDVICMLFLCSYICIMFVYFVCYYCHSNCVCFVIYLVAGWAKTIDTTLT